MQAKTKWIAALATFCGVMIVAIISMGIIWAASSQQVQTSIRVTYTVSGNVICDVSATKYTTSANTATAFTGGSNGVISFNAADASQTGTLSITDTELTTSDQVVIFEYVITNKNQSAALSASLATGSATNMTFYVKAPSATRLTNPVSTFDATAWTQGNSIAATEIPAATASANTTYYAYVAVKVTDLNLDASFEGTFTWSLAAGTAVTNP